MFLQASEILPKIIHDFIQGRVKPIEQNHKEATFCKILTRESGHFEINSPPSPEMLDKMIRAYYPWPGTWTKWNNKIVKLHPKNRIQIEGKKAMPLQEFLNGYPNFPLKQL
jgi:methionyl-tRNA formyltransferase